MPQAPADASFLWHRRLEFIAPRGKKKTACQSNPGHQYWQQLRDHLHVCLRWFLKGRRTSLVRLRCSPKVHLPALFPIGTSCEQDKLASLEDAPCEVRGGAANYSKALLYTTAGQCSDFSLIIIDLLRKIKCLGLNV